MATNKRDYVAIAKILKDTETTSQDGEDAITQIALALAQYFRRTNPAFDTGRFYEAVGYGRFTTEKE